jgi:hypothetical protein
VASSWEREEGVIYSSCEFDKWHKVAQEVEERGGKVISFAFDLHGLQTWEVNGLLNGGPRNGY